jgi:hypothetical protein
VLASHWRVCRTAARQIPSSNANPALNPALIFATAVKEQFSMCAYQDFKLPLGYLERLS